MSSIINVDDISFTYVNHHDEESVQALNNINIDIKKGQFVVIVGRNGSGKSTFARLLNAILLPDIGNIYINGMNTRNGEFLWDIRRSAGMIFQNPDNQIVGTSVEEDIAFAPENLGVPSDEIRKRVDESMEMVGISKYAKHEPHLLSGGQKQRVAIAGILAMRPECIILDESTAMLDPVGRVEVMNIMKKLNKEENITVIHITHHMDEAANADRVIVINNGCIVGDGKPESIFSQVEMIKSIGLDVPQVVELLYELNKEGHNFPLNIMTVEQAFDLIKKALRSI